MDNSFTTVVREPKPWSIRFGKHKGKTLELIWQEDPKYIQWLMLEPWIDQKLKNYIVKQTWYDVCPAEI